MKINKIFIILISIVILFICIFNYSIDRYGVFYKYKKTPKNYLIEFQRNCIYPQIINDSKNHFDYLLLGSSNADMSLMTEAFEEITGKKIYKLILNGGTIDDFIEITKIFKECNNEDFTVIWAIDYFIFIEKSYLTLFPFKKNTILLEDYLELLLSKTTLQDSITDYFIQKNQQKEIQQNCEPLDIFPKRRLQKIENKRLRYENIEKLKKFKKYLDDNNIKSIFFLHTLNALNIANLYRFNMYEDFETVKKEIAKITSFYDFAYVNDKYTAMPISLNQLYFQDTVHSRWPLGNIIIEELFHTNNYNFGILLNENNVENELSKQRKALEEYMKDNKKLIDEYMSYGTDDFMYYESKCIPY